eukprot:322420_1
MDEATCETTRSAFKDLIKKPKLSSKLLTKPPFRFLQDVVMNTLKSSGFPEGVFPNELLGRIKDKADKLEFLRRIFSCVSFATETEFSLKPSKVVAGLDPAKTNAFLVKFAEAATRHGSEPYDLSKIIDFVNSGQHYEAAKAVAGMLTRPRRHSFSLPAACLRSSNSDNFERDISARFQPASSLHSRIKRPLEFSPVNRGFPSVARP